MDWFLENAWIIPFIPAVSFVLILAFGKRAPDGGSEIGIAVGRHLLRARRLGTGVAWIQHVNSRRGRRAEAASTPSASWPRPPKRATTPSSRSMQDRHLVPVGGHEFRRHPDRRPRGDHARHRHA